MRGGALRVVKRLALVLMLGLFVATTVGQVGNAAAAARAPLPLFSTETAAQAHCPSDVVVWLNTKTGIWHEKGMRWYGRTKYGAYVCRKEAAAAGYRDTENGQ